MGKKIIDFVTRHTASRGRKSKTGGGIKSKAAQLYTPLNQIETAARKSIGKRTFKENKVRTSKEIKILQVEKRKFKKEIQQIKNDQMGKSSLIEKYKITQNLIAEQILTEKTVYITNRLEKIIADTSRRAFWNETKAMSRDPMTDSLVVKDHRGNRQFQPDAIK